MEEQEIKKIVDNKKKIPCEIYSRVVGYYRPISQWNEGKKKEFRERKPLKVKKEEYDCKRI